MLKKENGVTLVALVITIIVLLILAGVTLAMVMGENGIFGKANKASENTNISSARDAVRLAVLEATTEQYNDETGAIDSSKEITTSNVTEKVNAKLRSAGNEYTIESGKIMKVASGSNVDTTVTVTFTVTTTHAVNATFNK